jgi:hypothetical protein
MVITIGFVYCWLQWGVGFNCRVSLVGGCHLVIYLLSVVECWLLIVGDVVLLLVCRISAINCWL